MSRFELRHIRAFVVLAEELHFRRAAERLLMTQPGLSRMIRWLEEEIGADLFLRTTRRVELTEAGSAFLVDCREVLAGVERSVKHARSAAAGDIGYVTVAYMDFAINGPLPRILKAFRQAYPRVRVELFYMPTAEQKKALLAGHVDVGLLIGPFQSDYIDTTLVESEPLAVLLPEDHSLTELDAVPLTALAGEPFVLGAKGGWSAFRRVVFDRCQQSGFSPQVVQEASTSDGIFGLVAADIGVSLYASCVRNIRRRGLTTRPLADTGGHIETVAAWRSDITAPSVSRFIETLRAFPGASESPHADLPDPEC